MNTFLQLQALHGKSDTVLAVACVYLACVCVCVCIHNLDACWNLSVCVLLYLFMFVHVLRVSRFKVPISTSDLFKVVAVS